MIHQPETGVIILAAGNSSRLQQPKQLLVYNGKTLLRRAVERALTLACGPVLIVTGALHLELEATCDGLPVTFVQNELWKEGMSTSIIAGLQALEAIRPDNIDSVLLMLSDQPLITITHLRELINVFRSEGQPGIVATAYAGTHGVPAVFSRALFNELYELKGDKGARALFAKHQDQLKTVLFEDAAVDIDTMGDWEKVRKSEKLGSPEDN